MRRLPIIVQHGAGEPGLGGPATALDRVLSSNLATRYDFVPMIQAAPARGLNLGLLRQFVHTLRLCRPDLVHVRGLGNEGFHGVLAARIARCPRILVSVHGTVRDLAYVEGVRLRLVRDICEPWTLAMATHVSTVCQWAAQRPFVVRTGSKFVGVVPNGVQIPAGSMLTRSQTRGTLGIGSEDVVLIIVARLTVEKGYLDLAAALAKIPYSGRTCHLLVVGEGPDHSAIREAMQPPRWLHVRFLGRRSDVADLLGAADVFILPSLHENLSNALVEAMAAGLPVVASSVGGNVEVVSKGGGELVPPADPGALTTVLERWIGDPTSRRALGARARKVVEENYTLDHMTGRLGEVYDRILSGPRKRPAVVGVDAATWR